MAKREDVQKDPDRFAQMARNIRRKQLEKNLRKTKLLTMRVSEADHEGFKRVASRLGLTVTDYVLKLHQMAVDRLK